MCVHVLEGVGERVTKTITLCFDYFNYDLGQGIDYYEHTA